MIRRRCPSSPPQAPTAPLEDDNLLEEILLRLHPQPSSLPRASAVCMRWRCLLSDPRFLRRFGKHHQIQKPPLLGCFSGEVCRNTVFNPTLDAPDRIPAARFPVPRPQGSYEHWYLVGCRHGLAVILNSLRREVILWHALTGHQRRVPYPPWFSGGKLAHLYHASVLCAAARDEDGHVPGECHLHPFKLAFVSCEVLEPTELCACLYVSESAAWGDMITTPTTSSIYHRMPSVMAGNSLCCLLRGGDILDFDLESESLSVIEKPADAHVDGNPNTFLTWQVIRTEDGGLGLAVLSKSELSIQFWQRKCNCDGVVGWEHQYRIRLNELFPMTVLKDLRQKFPGMKLACMLEVEMVGYDEDANVIVLATYIGDFTLQLEPVQLKQFTRRYCQDNKIFYPYSSFYTTGRRVDGGAEI